VLAAVLCGVAVAMNMGKVPIAMTQLRADFGLSLVEAGWVSSMISLLGVTVALPFGLAGDRLGAFRTCILGLLLSILGGVSALLSGGTQGLLVSRLLEGAGFIAVAVSAPTLLSSATSLEDRRFTLTIWSGYPPAGVGLVMLLAPLVLPWAGWQGLWLLAVLLSLLAIIALGRARRAYRLPSPAASAPPPFAGAVEPLRRPEPWLLGFALTSWTVQYTALVTWLPTFLQEQRGLPPLAVSLLSCLVVLANVPGNLLGGRLLRRVRYGRVIASASLVTGLCGFGIFLDALPDLPRYGLCIVLSFTGGLIPASVLSASVSFARTPRQIGILQGLFMQCSNLGPFIGPPLVAMLVARSGAWGDAVPVLGVASLLGLILGLLLQQRERRGLFRTG
jgi:MFS family permease